MTVTSTAGLDHEIGADGVLQIRTQSGSIRLRATATGSVRVHGDPGFAAHATVEAGDGSLAIRTAPDPRVPAGDRDHGHDIDLIIDVPVRATVVAETASGTISSDGLLGDQRYRTASGDIVLRAVAGHLSIEAVSGDVDATVVDDAAITARTVSGDLAVRAVTLTSLQASTTSGDLRLAGRLSGAGPFGIETVSGDAVLALAGDARIELQTLTGDLRSDIGARLEGTPDRRVATIGTAGPVLRVRSLSGDVRLVPPVAVTRPANPVTIAVAPDQVTDAGDATSPDLDPTLEIDRDTAAEAARLAILRSLERGEIDVAEAGRRLEAVEPSVASTKEPTDA